MTIPTNPTTQIVAATAKYPLNRPQTSLTPSPRQLLSEPSHSDSGSHRRERHAERSWTAKAKLTSAPRREMARETDLCMATRWEREGEEGGERG